MTGVAARCVLAAVGALAAVTVCAPLDAAGAVPAEPAGHPAPPLGSAILTEALPGFATVPAGPTNGPLTATEFASQSSNPQQAERQFAALSSQPGFGAFIRLWTDRDGPGHGANDLAVLVFRIPDTTEAGAFTTGLLAPFDGLPAAIPFTVPSVPGARGYSIQVTSPVDATEQVVVFRAGRYVSMIQLASTTSGSNPTPLTRSQAITVSYQQSVLVRQVDPAGSAASEPPPPTHRAAASGRTPTDVQGTSSSSDLVWLLGPVALAGGAVVVGLWAVRRRRRTGRAPEPASDPWGPDGIFASFGAVDPGRTAVKEGLHEVGEGRGPGDTVAAGRHGPAQAVPALVPTAPAKGLEDPVPLADPVRS
jgi:hypothetical protein